MKSYIFFFQSVLTLLFLIIFATTTLASDKPTSLETIEKILTDSPAISGNFKQIKTIKILSKPLISSGRFIVIKNKGILWQIKSPVTSTLIITPEKTISLENTAYPLAQSVTHTGQILNDLLSGRLFKLRRHFDVSNLSVINNNWQLTLVPKSALMKRIFQKIKLKGNHFINEIELVEENNDRIQIIFSSIIQHTSVSKEMLDEFP